MREPTRQGGDAWECVFRIGIRFGGGGVKDEAHGTFFVNLGGLEPSPNKVSSQSSYESHECTIIGF